MNHDWNEGVIEESNTAGIFAASHRCRVCGAYLAIRTDEPRVGKFTSAVPGDPNSSLTRCPGKPLTPPVP